MSVKAVFLDRDGVLCEDTDYVTSFEKLHIFSFAKEAVELFHQKGYLAIVVTNQSGVARGMMSEKMVKDLNHRLQEETGVDDIYYCPHLPPEGAEVFPYRIFCNCRKPQAGMILRGAQEWDIVLADSYMVGDRESDIAAGKKAGVKTVAVAQNGMTLRGADICCRTVLDFAEKLV